MHKIVALTKCDISAVSHVQISRRYDGMYIVSFPDFSPKLSIGSEKIVNILSSSKNEINDLNEQIKSESGIKDKTIESIDKVLSYISNKDSLNQSDFEVIKKLFAERLKQAATSDIFPKYDAMKAGIEKEFAILNVLNQTNSAEAHKLILGEMPSFVYYSNYGNLDAQIYLQHVVKLLNGEKIEGFDNEA